MAAPQAASAEIRVYDHLFKTEYPDDAPEGKTFLDNINPDSLSVVRDAKLEPSLAAAQPGTHFQFERLGYFFTHPVDSKPGKPVFNRTATDSNPPASAGAPAAHTRFVIANLAISGGRLILVGIGGTIGRATDRALILRKVIL